MSGTAGRDHVTPSFRDCGSGPCNSVVPGLRVGTISLPSVRDIVSLPRNPSTGGKWCPCSTIPSLGYILCHVRNPSIGVMSCLSLAIPTLGGKWCPSTAIPPPGGNRVPPEQFVQTGETLQKGCPDGAARKESDITDRREFYGRELRPHQGIVMKGWQGTDDAYYREPMMLQVPELDLAAGDDLFAEIPKVMHQKKKPKKPGIPIPVLCHITMLLFLPISVSFSKLPLFFCILCM